MNREQRRRLGIPPPAAGAATPTPGAQPGRGIQPTWKLQAGIMNSWAWLPLAHANTYSVPGTGDVTQLGVVWFCFELTLGLLPAPPAKEKSHA